MRSKSGWLSPAALRDGLIEEWAIDMGEARGVTTRHRITLGYAGFGSEPHQWVVTRWRFEGEAKVEEHKWWFVKLNEARDVWKRQVQRTAT